MYNNLERRGEHLGPGYDQRAEVRRLGGARDLRSARSTTCSSGSAAPAPSRPTSRSRCGRCSRSCARKASSSACLSKERCTGDPAKRTGNEYMFQELANANIEDLKAAGAEEDPHVVPALREDDRRRLPASSATRSKVVHSAVFVEELTRVAIAPAADRRRRDRDLSRSLLSRALRRQGRRAARAARAVRRATCKEPVRNRDNPVLLRRGRRAAVRRQGRGAGHAHQRRAVQAAAGHRRRHGGDGLPVLLDHAEGRAGERARGRTCSSST